MKHLYSISAYDFDTDGYGGISAALDRIEKAGADGIELLTGYFTPDERFADISIGTHLPYATDWYSAWTGDMKYIDMVSDDDIRYRAYGRNREQIVNAVKDGIVNASSVDPGYGVLHASNTRMDEVMGFVYRDSDEDILRATAELLNDVAEQFPGGEPPFRILLENLWWPGLTMTDDSGFLLLEEELRFGNWGLCLDTGHLMNRLGDCREERKSIGDLIDIVKRYPRRMIDKIRTIHLHMSLSGDYQEQCRKYPIEYEVTGESDIMTKAYEHVCRIDQHRPFGDKMCTKIADLLRPEQVTHEISAATPEERLSGFAKQRSLFL